MLNSLKRAGLREAVPFTSRTSVQATGFSVLVLFSFEQSLRDVESLATTRIWQPGLNNGRVARYNQA